MTDSWLALGVFAALATGPAVVSAQPAAPGPAPSPAPQPAPPPESGAPVQPTTAAPAEPPPPTPKPPPSQPVTSSTPSTSPSPSAGTTVPAGSAAVDDAAWDALHGRQVVVETSNGPVKGELLRSEGDTLVLIHHDGQVITLPKANALGVRVAKPGASASPASDTTPSPAEEMAALDPPESSEPGEEAAEDEGSPEDEDEAEEELSAGEKRRKERREKREHALLGAFTMHGATYSHWRGDGVQSGGASYAMDWGLGLNLAPSFGMYAIAGGLLGAKIDNKRINANYGHAAFVFAFSRKYFFSTIGAGFAWSRLRALEGSIAGNGQTVHKDRGLAIPTRLVGKIPLPHKLYLGIGITYELGLVRGFSRAINGIGGQLVVGRW